jgi:DNA repair protein RecN (Recombination protein N)
MLSRLFIKNIALIDALDVEFAEGLNVLSGETGAGKSIIIDAVNLVLGERADRELIRTGAPSAAVEAWFSDIRGVDDILEEQQIEADDELVLSRELSASGRNVCRVNGTLVTLAVLKALSDRLVDVHGQHEHQSLLSEKNHIAMLDSFDEAIGKAAADVSEAYNTYSAVLKRIKTLFGSEGDRERRIDILKFQINELKQAAVTEGEEEELILQRTRLNAAERIMEALTAAYEVLYDAEPINVLSALKDANRRLTGIADVDARYDDMAAKVDEAYYTLEEVASAVRHEMNEEMFDPDALERIEERLALIAVLKRKYGDPLITGDYLRGIEQEFTDLLDSDALLKELTSKAQTLKEQLYGHSIRLSEMRRNTAKRFDKLIMQQLADLGMGDASFEVWFAELPSINDAVFSPEGIDTVEFYISTNRGEPLKPLRKVASGGEVSRIMLALKTVAADKGGIPTMIFDEIDTGISGRIAQVVAEKLSGISRGRQVVCVTHLPQIASMADRHFLITKHSDETTTRTYLAALDGTGRIKEIARLTGGDSEASLAHASEMLQRADHFKTSI